MRGVVHLIEDRQKSAHRLARTHEPDDDFSDNAKGSFGADENTAEIVTGHVRNFAAQPDYRALIEHHFEPKHVIGGHAVGERMRPAGIIGHVTADGAGRLAAGIGRVEETVFGDRFGDVDVDHAGFDDSDAIFQIDF